MFLTTAEVALIGTGATVFVAYLGHRRELRRARAELRQARTGKWADERRQVYGAFVNDLLEFEDAILRYNQAYKGGEGLSAPEEPLPYRQYERSLRDRFAVINLLAEPATNAAASRSREELIKAAIRTYVEGRNRQGFDDKLYRRDEEMYANTYKVDAEILEARAARNKFLELARKEIGTATER